jgi:hypothetical protein
MLIDPASDIVVGYGTTVAKLSGQTGVEIWRQESRGTQSPGTSIALDPAGDVVATGVPPDGRRNDLPIFKLAGSTGDRLWSQTVTGPPRIQRVGISEGVGGAVVIDPAGTIRAIGLVGRAALDDGGPCLTGLVAYRTQSPSSLPASVPSLILYAAQFSDRIAGRSLRVLGTSAEAALRLVAVDRNVLAPAAGSLGDLTQGGAFLTFLDEVAGTQVSVPLAASGWRTRSSGRPQGPVYQYRAADGASTLCRDVGLATGALMVRCAGVRPITLDKLGVRGAVVVLTLPGSGFRYCLRFVGTVIATGAAQRFVAGPAPAPTTCPAISSL